MADEFSYARYMPIVPTGGVMSALPKAGSGESWSPEMDYQNRISGMSFGANPYLSGAQGPLPVFENLPKDFYLNRTPGENFADIVRRASEYGAFKGSPQAENLALGGQMLFEMIPGVAEGNTAVAFNRGDYGQAALEASGTIPGGKVVGGALAAGLKALGSAIPPGGISKLVNGYTEDQAKGAARAAREERKLSRAEARANQEIIDRGYATGTYDPNLNMYSQAEVAMSKFPKDSGRASDIYKYLVKNGVNKDELELIGIAPGTTVLSKDDVLNKIRASNSKMPQVEVVEGPINAYKTEIMRSGPADRGLSYSTYNVDLIKIKNPEIDTFPQRKEMLISKLEEEKEKISKKLREYTPVGDGGETLKILRERAFYIQDDINDVRAVSDDQGLREVIGLSPEARRVDHFLQKNTDYLKLLPKAYRSEHFKGQNIDLGANVLRFDGIDADNMHVRRIAEVQSDKARDYRKELKQHEADMEAWRKNGSDPETEPVFFFDTDVYTKDEKWSPLVVKQTLLKAAKDGVDIIELPTPESVTTRWRGAPEKSIKTLDNYYSKSLPAEFDMWVEKMGGKAKVVDKSTPLHTKDLVALKEEIGTTSYIAMNENGWDKKATNNYKKKLMLDFAKKNKIDLSGVNLDKAVVDLEGFEDLVYDVYANVGRTGEISDIKEIRSKADAAVNEAKAKLDEAIADIKDIKQYKEKEWPNLSKQEQVLQSPMYNDFSTRLWNWENDKKAFENKVETAKLLKALVDSPGNTYSVRRYELTPDIRKKIIKQGFQRMAKGGLVDLAKYMAWNS